jgi:hypothetical protein
MKIYYSILLLLFPFCVLAQKDAAISRTQYYNAGFAASVKSYSVLLNTKATGNPSLYKIYKEQYARQQQRVAVLAGNWASGKYSSKKINAALALVGKADVSGAIKLMEGVLNRKDDQHGGEETIFLAELYELNGAYDKAENVLNGKELNLAESLYHSWLLASTGQTEQALIQTDRLLGQFAADTIGLVRIKLQRCFIDTMVKDYAGAGASMIEAQFLLEKIAADTLQQYWSGIVSGQLGQLQGRGNNIDNAYRNAQSSAAIADGLNNLPMQAWAHHIIGNIYKKGGANQQADTHFRTSIDAYTKLSAAYPQQYRPLLADVMNEYVEVLRWFDRKEESMLMLEKTATIRKSLAESNYPFFVLDYAGSIGRIADQYVFASSNIDTAEANSKKEKDLLAALYTKYPLLAGADYSNVLNKLGDINMTLKRYTDGIHYLTAALEVQQRLYDAYPETYKQGLMELLIRNGTANGFYGNNIVLAYQQLDRAATLATELKELRAAQSIEKIKQQLSKK